jgi:hypothetical protein
MRCFYGDGSSGIFETMKDAISTVPINKNVYWSKSIVPDLRDERYTRLRYEGLQAYIVVGLFKTNKLPDNVVCVANVDRRGKDVIEIWIENCDDLVRNTLNLMLQDRFGLPDLGPIVDLEWMIGYAPGGGSWTLKPIMEHEWTNPKYRHVYTCRPGFVPTLDDKVCWRLSYVGVPFQPILRMFRDGRLPPNIMAIGDIKRESADFHATELWWVCDPAKPAIKNRHQMLAEFAPVHRSVQAEFNTSLQTPFVKIPPQYAPAPVKRSSPTPAAAAAVTTIAAVSDVSDGDDDSSNVISDSTVPPQCAFELKLRNEFDALGFVQV